MGKKGGKKGGSGGKAAGGKKDGWQPTSVPVHQLMPRVPIAEAHLTVSVRGVAWSLLNFTARVPARTTVSELADIIAGRQGLRGNHDFILYKDSMVRPNVLSDPEQPLHALKFDTQGDAPCVIICDSKAGSFWDGVQQLVVAQLDADLEAALQKPSPFCNPTRVVG